MVNGVKLDWINFSDGIQCAVRNFKDSFLGTLRGINLFYPDGGCDGKIIWGLYYIEVKRQYCL